MKMVKMLNSNFSMEYIYIFHSFFIKIGIFTLNNILISNNRLINKLFI